MVIYKVGRRKNTGLNSLKGISHAALASEMGMMEGSWKGCTVEIGKGAQWKRNRREKVMIKDGSGISNEVA